MTTTAQRQQEGPEVGSDPRDRPRVRPSHVPTPAADAERDGATSSSGARPSSAAVHRPDLEDRLDPSLISRITPIFKLLRLYSRLEVEGVERIPDGPVILAANHTGWLGLDYAYTALAVKDARGRFVRGLAHKTWFLREKTADLASRLGLFEVGKDTMRALLDRGEAILIFPEGERGAFKPVNERYLLQPFARGFVRVAFETGAPIMPVAIVGGEEANPSSARLDSYEDLLDLSLPVPMNLFPRPVKWRISFLPPVSLGRDPEAASDSERVHEIGERVRSEVQYEIQRLISARGHPYL